MNVAEIQLLKEENDHLKSVIDALGPPKEYFKNYHVIEMSEMLGVFFANKKLSSENRRLWRIIDLVKDLVEMDVFDSHPRGQKAAIIKNWIEDLEKEYE